MTRKIFTPGRLIISVICVAGIITTFVRFAKGLGAVTNLSDRFPWGLWVGFDVLCGVALATAHHSHRIFGIYPGFNRAYLRPRKTL